jgi:RNA polymerase-binding transcription factor DksA
MAEDRAPESSEHVICPECGKPIPIARMNVCYIARYDCPHCGALMVIEGNRITIEKDDAATD